jgi:hypothetical protein
VREHATDPGERRPRQRQEIVHDRQFHLADDRQVVLEQQVVVAVDAAADRVLDGQDAVRDAPARNRGEHFVEAVERDRFGVRAGAERRRFTVCARGALECDTHGVPSGGSKEPPYTTFQRL